MTFETNATLVLEAIQKAIEAEREACAKVADAVAAMHYDVQKELTGPHGEMGEEAHMAMSSVWASEQIAAAIRARKP